jgi:hypothetical protein
MEGQLIFAFGIIVVIAGMVIVLMDWWVDR